MNKRLLKNIDIGIIICVFLLIVIGLISLYSASESTNQEEFKKQCIWILISLPIMLRSSINRLRNFGKIF